MSDTPSKPRKLVIALDAQNLLSAMDFRSRDALCEKIHQQFLRTPHSLVIASHNTSGIQLPSFKRGEPATWARDILRAHLRLDAVLEHTPTDEGINPQKSFFRKGGWEEFKRQHEAPTILVVDVLPNFGMFKGEDLSKAFGTQSAFEGVNVALVARRMSTEDIVRLTSEVHARIASRARRLAEIKA